MRWISYLNGKSYRINQDDKHFEILKITPQSLIINRFNGIIEIKPDDTVWFRRISIQSSYFIKGESTDIGTHLKMFAFRENREVFVSAINWIINNCNYIGNPFQSAPNKPDILIQANRFNLKTPEWIVTSTKSELLKFYYRNSTLIIKTFHQFGYTNSKESYRITNQLVDLKDIKEYPEKFKSTFFQKYIDKMYELRIFYWKGSFFPMAIFSQQDPITRIDFRNYNIEKPNRNVPAKVENKYLGKLMRLAKSNEMDTGSFDVLINKNNEKIFLEINPIGQFGMVSHPCNYYIEKFIAENLLKT